MGHKKGQSTVKNHWKAGDVKELVVNPAGEIVPKYRGGAYKGMPTRNPSGRPRDGESWAALIKKLSNMTGMEAAKHCRRLASQFEDMGDNLTLKEHAIFSVLN